MNPRSQKKSDQTRSRVVDAAFSLFLSQGFHATSMRQIAAAASVTLGGIYNHFSSKEAIWLTVLTEKHPYHTILPVLMQAEGTTKAAYIRDLAQRMVEALRGHPDLLNMLFIEIVEFNSAHITTLFSVMLPDLLGLANRFNLAAGSLRPIPPPVLLRAFFGMFFSFFMTQKALSALEPLMGGEAAFDTFVDIFLHGVLAEEGAIPAQGGGSPEANP